MNVNMLKGLSFNSGLQNTALFYSAIAIAYKDAKIVAI